MNMNEEAIRNAVSNVSDAFRGYWLNADELAEILGLQGHLSLVVRSLKKIQSNRAGLEFTSVQLTRGFGVGYFGSALHD
jgi:hypothetical protein